MNLTTRLIVMFALVALFGVGTAAWLSARVTSSRVEHFFQMEDSELDEHQGQMRRGLMFRASPGRLELLSDLRRANLQAAAIALAAALIVGSFFAYRLSRPIRTLTHITHRYTQGERTTRAATKGKDELAKLGQAFNLMADQLQNEEERKQRLVADIAHELRTPLTILKSELEALEDGLLEATPNSYRRLVDEVDLLGRLVQDLRLLSLAEAGELSLEKTQLDLAEVVREVGSSFAPKIQQKNAALEQELNPVQVEADPDRLKQIVMNLLENALRHTPQGGNISIATKQQGNEAILTVSDSGPGIPESDLPHLFDRFYRVDKARTRETGGSGLGLAIVKTLVALHNGQVNVENRAEQGAVFRITLPLARSLNDNS